MDDLVRVPGRRRRLLLGALGVVAVVLAAGHYAQPFVHALGTTYGNPACFHASILWGVLVVAATAAAALVRAIGGRAALIAAVVAIDALVLFAVPEFSAPRATTVDLAPVAYLRQLLGEERFDSLGPLAPNYGSYFALASFGVHDFPPKPYSHYVHTRANPRIAFASFQPKGPSQQWELMHHLPLPAGRCALHPHPRLGTLPQSPTSFRLVFQSPTRASTSLTGLPPTSARRAVR